MTSNDFDRFMKMVWIDEDDCWYWLGTKIRGGYGRFSLNRKQVLSHRACYEHLVEEIPDGLVLDHLCRHTSCCNPAHLEPVTQQENTLRGNGRAAKQARQLYCLRGHSLASARLEKRPNGRVARKCRQCQRLRYKHKHNG